MFIVPCACESCSKTFCNSNKFAIKSCIDNRMVKFHKIDSKYICYIIKMDCQILTVGEYVAELCRYFQKMISNEGYRHKSERGYQCGRVRWGRAATQWTRTGSRPVDRPLLITRNTLLNRLQVSSWCWTLSGTGIHQAHLKLNLKISQPLYLELEIHRVSDFYQKFIYVMMPKNSKMLPICVNLFLPCELCCLQWRKQVIVKHQYHYWTWVIFCLQNQALFS